MKLLGYLTVRRLKFKLGSCIAKEDVSELREGADSLYMELIRKFKVVLSNCHPSDLIERVNVDYFFRVR